MNKRDETILRKILEESNALSSIINGIDESLFLKNDEKTRAVCMTLINIGELV